jgi:hypothetical protein
MSYERKTRDYWDIEMWTGSEWEVCNSEDTWKDTRRSLKEHRENAPEYSYRAKRRRERIEVKS